MSLFAAGEPGTSGAGTGWTLYAPLSMVEQWTAVHGVPAKPARSERNGPVTRNFYTDSAGSVRVESVLVQGLAHAFPFALAISHHAGSPAIL
jgi:poly(3-hydroxybutyrate) depolymerase